MNQDQIKTKLLELQESAEEFSVTFSGKKSKKVNGLYKPEEKEILIHNKNLENDDSLLSAAIHEFAHHIHITTSVSPVSPTSHTTAFWNIFHTLLSKAEELGLYNNPFRSNEEFVELTKRVKEEYLSVNGELMLAFGKIMVRAQELCLKYSVSFEEYIDRELCMDRSTAKTIMKCSTININPEIGYDNMKIVAGINDTDVAKEAETAFALGQSRAMVNSQYNAKTVPESRLKFMLSERERIVSTIERLSGKLDEVEHSIQELQVQEDLP